MIVFMKKKPVWCVICHEAATRVDHTKVPVRVKIEFARLNRWAMLSKNGWFHCKVCDIYMHKPTIDAVKRS